MERTAIRVANIEAGMPDVETGKKRLSLEIATAKRLGIKAIKVIHGYGSTGKGGKLKKGLLEYLEQQRKKGLIKAFVPGDEWSIFNPGARAVLDLYSDLRKDSDLNRNNPGITIVLL